MNRFIKVLAIINGLLIPTIILFALYQAFKPFSSKKDRQEDGIIVGERLEQAKKDSMMLQGLSFEQPMPIYNSSNFYLPISVLTYEEARSMKQAMGSAGDYGWNLRHVGNVLFLNKDYEVIGTLIGEKASISDINIKGKPYKNEQVDEGYKYLTYMIGYEDTNQDGQLNSQDNHDLYLSDLKGQGLRQVSKGVDIVSYEFVDSYSKINIRYKERTGGREEYRKVKFAYFDLVNSNWVEYRSLNEKLAELENELTK